MLLSLVLHTYSMRYLLPSILMLGSAPTYLLAWTLWRVLSALLPARLYQRVDDRLYCVYQNMVLFFFENYTGVQVRRAPPPLPPGGRCSLQPGEHVLQHPALPPRGGVGWWWGRSLCFSPEGSFWNVLQRLSVFPGPPPHPPPRPGRLFLPVSVPGKVGH